MINERFKQVRKVLGFSQKEFANTLGIGLTTLKDYEKGKFPPKTEVIQKLTHLFNINPTWLLTGQGSMFLEVEEPKDDKERIIKEFADYLRTQDYEDVKTFWEFVKRWKLKTPSR